MNNVGSVLAFEDFKNVSPTLEEKQSLLLVTFFQKKNEFNRNETQMTSAPQPTSNSEIIDRLNSISSDVENLKQLFYDFSKRVMADLELFKNTFIISATNDGKKSEDTTDAFGLETDNINGNVHSSPIKDKISARNDGKNTEYTTDAFGLETDNISGNVHSSPIKDKSGHENVVTAVTTKSEALQKRAQDKSGHENVVTAFRTKAEALQKRAEDKSKQETVVKSGQENVVTAIRTTSEALQKRAEDKFGQETVVKSGQETVVTAISTKSDALQTRAEDKAIGESRDHDIISPAEDDDPFSPINTQFLVEVDTAEKINLALKEKNQSEVGADQRNVDGGKISENVEPVSTALVVFRDTGNQPPCDINLKKKKEKRLEEESSPKVLPF
ncbi:translation initiation factor IF-2 [Striga asiatica]|uniref:Translation initiation factor IF-2 n=1 Tax=Striga asiatica TaxID=4170 RepID=A0A5A7QMP7_STRAF|nr:translation initiation factor IF-2 [Striga asiatica]